nr:MAG TPA: hypothetical protein [Caudoviricetes sp.]
MILSSEHIPTIAQPFIDFFVMIFTPGNLALLILLGNVVKRIFDKLTAIANQQQDEHIKEIDKKIDDIIDKVDKLAEQQKKDQHEAKLNDYRLEIILGIYTGKMTESEILTVYGKYEDEGGNSYMSRVIDAYITEQRKKERKKNL